MKNRGTAEKANMFRLSLLLLNRESESPAGFGAFSSVYFSDSGVISPFSEDLDRVSAVPVSVEVSV